MIFLDLVELAGQGAEEICTSLLNSLHLVGFDREYLKNKLTGFNSDGASVMLGGRSGVGIKLKNDFPDIILWHCLNHRLQLVLDDFVTDRKQVNHFKILWIKYRPTLFFINQIKAKLNFLKFLKNLGNKL